MSETYKYERSLFSFEEFEPVHRTHHPHIYDVSSDDLRALRSDLRAMREKEKTHAREKRREARGKGEPRGGSFPGTAEHPKRRKQVVSSALRRVNSELKRRKRIEAKASHVEAAQRALALRKADRYVTHPEADAAYHEGMQSLPSRRRRWVVPPAKIGSVSQWTKRSQAVRDAKG